MGLKIKKWLTNSRFELREARAPRHKASRRIQLSPCRNRNSTTALTVTVCPSTRCCLSLRSGSVEMTRKYSVLWEISFTGIRLIKKASLASLNFTTSTARFWKLSRKCTRVFVVSADSIPRLFEKYCRHCMRKIYLICCQTFPMWCTSL